MPVSTPHRARPSPTPSPSSSRSSTSTQIELLYNTAAQSFVRRDHLKTLSTLTRLFGLLAIQPGPSSVWYDLIPGSDPFKGVEKEMDDWRSKVLKLYISSWVSLYSDPPTPESGLTGDIQAYLPPTPPSDLLLHLHQISLTHSLPPTAPLPILPPSILSTLLLGALRLQPTPIALDTAHRLTEDWLAAVPETLLRAISRDNGCSGEAEEKRKMESAREGYVKVIELFVGEVLVREGEWEMARAFLEGEGVMGSKRKENLYRHIRSAQSRPRSAPSSPSNSLVLPSPSSSGILPSRSNGSSTTRSRSSSASSSSSEATARPHTTDRLSVVGHPTRRSARGRDQSAGADQPAEGKDKEIEVEADDEKEAIASISTKSSLPSRLYINHSPASSSRVPLRSKPTSSGSRSTGSSAGQGGTAGNWETLLVLLPKSAQIRLRPILYNPWLVAAISIPIPLLTILTAVLIIRRKILKKRNEVAGKVLEGVAVGGVTVATDVLKNVRDKLRLTRERGVREWLRAWMGWWIKKFLGVWRMGTTITYL